ncbi:MAG TPA: hypothetical protein PLQ89_16170 [Phycisphaerae bacterium]|nr:hypothetical protein [Phycisphaerae bacterium]HOM50884.1 hypothetical protein [Phycisphaerae bacterium]HOQ87250.1 hypothetical protein [Phycisphaerae bacterium]HPP25941.1 hypothetical protein [Phycisphaerae bacterium]HPU26868.1 hypothetical protein [Phycisphaerae bacterium]
MGRLTVEPLIPASLWLLLAVLAVLLLAWYAASRPGRMARPVWVLIVSLMSTGLALVLIVLLNPTWIDPVDPPQGKPLLTIVVDDSASMAVKDAGETGTRFDIARRTANQLARDLAGRFEVRLRSFAAEVAPTETSELDARKPEGPLTDLTAAVAGSVEADRPAGQAVVLISDGIHNAGGGTRELRAAIRAARAAGAPVYTHALGRADVPDVFDLEAEIRSPRQLAYVGQQVPITVRVRERGGPGGNVEVTLLHDGQPVETRTVTLPPSGVAEAEFKVGRDAPGIYRYEARVQPRPGELIAINNTAVQFLEVVNEPIRVLLLEGKPYWDGKFLMRTLAADPVVALDSVVRMAEGRYLRRALDPVPATQPEADSARDERWKVIPSATDILADPQALEAYQIVVLGRDTQLFLNDTALTNLRRWISRQGGSLVCYRGSPAVQIGRKLAQILPVEWAEGTESRFHVQLTEEGESLRWLGDLDGRLDGGTLAALPTLATASRVQKPRPLATVLATAGKSSDGQTWPVITSQNYGTGKIVVIEGAGMWRWAFLPPQHQEHGAVYGTLWQSLMRWLVSGTALRPGQEVDLRCDRVLFESSEVAWATLLLSETALGRGVPSVELFVVGEDNAIGSFTPSAAGDDPGVFRVSFGPLPPGQYEVRVAETPGVESVAWALPPFARFDVRAPVREQLELAARPDLMSLIAHESGGAVLTTGSAREVLDAFEQFRRQTQPERVRKIPAWDRWYVLVGVLGVWATAWGVRRRAGLI